MDLAAAHQQLEEMLVDLDRSLATLTAESARDDNSTGRETRTADPGSLLSDADREDAVIEAMQAQRAQVRAALDRISEGTYGRCVVCGQELPVERLEARPEAARCVADQALAENGR